ncbi:hypothetical protein [Streptomyces sp. TS71-3]|uniref:hypothetical protein n=1 Tax=Streptomyces sp. TS71-3 TaxID=2733862 RepID=UPI001B119F24|nr:hypothetical protein [Streptomyces sp. TS71-3]GHJ34935.1 hypothetical protein Sm713_05440 [Streptomyces sp. TS71-3]
MTEPVSRTILLLDIERYSDRDDIEQTYLRRRLYDVTDRALQSAGIDETLRLRADRGDSVMELVDANASVPALLRALLTQVPDELREMNRLASSTVQIRLRVVVATGYVAVDDRDGWVGTDLNNACRLLDAQVLRDALKERPSGMALCVSPGIHAGIVRHDHRGIPAHDFHAITVHSKNGPLEAWLHGPLPTAGSAGPADPTASQDHSGTGGGPVRSTLGERSAPALEREQNGPTAPSATATHGGGPSMAGWAFHTGGGSVSFGGGLVGGDQHVVSGGQQTGDVYLGGRTEIHRYEPSDPAAHRTGPAQADGTSGTRPDGDRTGPADGTVARGESA